MKVKVTGNKVVYKEYEVEFEFKNSKIAELIKKMDIKSCELAIVCSLLSHTSQTLSDFIATTGYSESSIRNALTKLLKLEVIKKIEFDYILNVLDDEQEN